MTETLLPGDAPLAQTFERVRAANPYAQVQIGPPAGQPIWPLADLLEPESPARDDHFAIMARQYKTDDPEVLVRAYFGNLVYAMASVTVGPYVVDRRVPLLDLADLRVMVGEWGTPVALVLPGTRFWCLPDDPAANHADAVPVADASTLRRLLRDHLVQVCAPLIAALRPRARIGARALWIAAAEACAGILIDALPSGTSEAEAQDALQALVGAPDTPLRARPEIIMLTSGTSQQLSLLGNDCCVNFR
ncbi:MAG: hypothetical protein KC442_23195, partial [Thermomicrobiales bacterium]|nr:hypothetical protein [Thermomicrobiales bacterium]